MADHRELIEEDAGLGPMLDRGVTQGFPPAHHRPINAPAFLDSQFVEAQRQARLRAIRAAKPDRSPPYQVAHHNPTGVPLANGNLIDADHPWGPEYPRDATVPAGI